MGEFWTQRSGEPDETTRRLLERLGELEDTYRQLTGLLRHRTSEKGRGKSGSLAAPIDLTALDLIAGHYWVGDPGDDPDDPLNYQPGLIVTIFGLERSARSALGLHESPGSRPRAYRGLGVDPRVLAALERLRRHATRSDLRELQRLIGVECDRLLARAYPMIHGPRYSASWWPCEWCGRDTVVADEDRAVCVNPSCRDIRGRRHCWRRERVHGVWGDWHRVDQPERGDSLPEGQLGRWSGGRAAAR